MKNFKYAPLIEAVLEALDFDDVGPLRTSLYDAISLADLPDVLPLDPNKVSDIKWQLVVIMRGELSSTLTIEQYNEGDYGAVVYETVDAAISSPSIPLAYWQILHFKKLIEARYEYPRYNEMWRQAFTLIDFWRCMSKDGFMDEHVCTVLMSLLCIDASYPMLNSEFRMIFNNICRSLKPDEWAKIQANVISRTEIMHQLSKIYGVKVSYIPVAEVDLTYVDENYNIDVDAKVIHTDTGRVREVKIVNMVLAYEDVKRPVLFTDSWHWRGHDDLEQLRYSHGLYDEPKPTPSAEELDQKFDDIIRENSHRWPQNLQVPFDTALNKHDLTEKLISDPILQPKATLEQLAEVGAQTKRIDDEPKTHVFNISHKDLTPQDERLAGLVGNVKYNQRLGRASRGGIMVKDNGIIAGWGLAADWVDSVSIPAAKLGEINGEKAMYEVSNDPDGVTLGSAIKPIVLIDPVLLEAIKNEVAKQIDECIKSRDKSNAMHNSSTVVDDNKHASSMVRAPVSSDGGTYVADADDTVDTTPESSHQSAGANDANDSLNNSVSYSNGQDRLLNGRYDAVDKFLDECRGLIESRRDKYVLELTRLDRVCKYMQVVRNLLKS